MRKIAIFTILLSLAIWSQASIDIVIGYNNNEKDTESKESAIIMQKKFSELYSNFKLTKTTTVSGFVNVIQTSKADTLIVLLIGHGAIIEPEKQKRLGTWAFAFNEIATTNDATNYYLVSKTLNYLIKKATATVKLVIIDACFASSAYSESTNANWFFASESYNITRFGAQLFTLLVWQALEKGDELVNLQAKINLKYTNKEFYPQFGKCVYADKNSPNITYPLKSISVGSFTF